MHSSPTHSNRSWWRRQNVMDSCRSTDIAKVQDELLSANVIDQECVDGNLDYFLNYPKKGAHLEPYLCTHIAH